MASMLLGWTLADVMNGLVWKAYTDLDSTLEPDEPLLTDSTRIYRRTRVLMAEAGVQPVNNRYGTHVFRRAWKEWCDGQGHHVSIASAGLAHSGTQVTERVYTDLDARQRHASAAMHQRA